MIEKVDEKLYRFNDQNCECRAVVVSQVVELTVPTPEAQSSANCKFNLIFYGLC